MSERPTVQFDLTMNVAQPVAEMKRLQLSYAQVLAAANGVLSILRKMTGNEDVENAIAQLQRLISALNMAFIAAMAVQAATGPVGWAIAGIGIIGTAISLGDLAGSYG